jgi:hypothetical protein
MFLVTSEIVHYTIYIIFVYYPMLQFHIILKLFHYFIYFVLSKCYHNNVLIYGNNALFYNSAILNYLTVQRSIMAILFTI